MFRRFAHGAADAYEKGLGLVFLGEGAPMDEVIRALLGLVDDLAVAAVAGWVAGRIVSRKGPGLAASLVCGLLGWLIGRGLLAVLGAGLFGLPMLVVSFLTALGGALALWVSLPLLKRA